jgi:hypothetical protein
MEDIPTAVPGLQISTTQPIDRTSVEGRGYNGGA